MTRDEWQAALVERTIANDWTSKLEKASWQRGPCPDCGVLILTSMSPGELSRPVVETSCQCGKWRALILGGGELVLPCENCDTLPNHFHEFVKAQDGRDSYIRFTCQCRFIRMRLD